MQYPFDLTAFSAMDLALLMAYAKQDDAGGLFFHVARFATFDVRAVPIADMQTVFTDFLAQLRAHLAALGMAPPEPSAGRSDSIAFSLDGESWTPLRGVAGDPKPARRRRTKAERAAEDAARRLIDQALGENGG